VPESYALARSYYSESLAIKQCGLADAAINLQVNLEVVGGSSKPMQTLSLIKYRNHRGLLSISIEAVREERAGLI
jgi:hypothetical protein